MKKIGLGMMMGLLVGLMAIGPFAGCASSTNITSEPSGASLKIDGQPVGKTPHSYQDDSVWIWTEHSVTLDKRGYETTNARFKADFHDTYLILGIVLFFVLCGVGGIFALIGQYKSTYNFKLMRKGSVERGGLQEYVDVTFAE